MSRLAPVLRRLRRFRRNDKGVAAVEFALLAPLFMLMVFAILEVALLFMAELVIEKAAVHAGREVRTGTVQQSRMTQEQFKKIVCDDVKFILSCDRLVFDLRSYASFAAVPTRIPMAGADIDASAFRYDYARGGTIVALRIFYKWPITTGFMRSYLASTTDGANVIMGASAFRTEPF